MNHIYRLVWNETTRTWAAVAETAKGRGKRSGAPTGSARSVRTLRAIAAKTIAVSLAFIGVQAWALDPTSLPTGGQVVAGSATISQAANALNVQQASQRAILDWQSFNIGAAASVNFSQPNASAVALNRILGNEASQIYGKLNANGQVFFINPNGMLFARGAQVNVGGLMATTLNIGNADFMSGNYRFANPGNGTIRNEGLINAVGSVVLVGNSVQNAGQIFATTATLAAGNTVALDLTGDGLIRARVEDAAIKAQVENSGEIGAASVTLSAGQSRDAINSVVNNTGLVRATGFASVGGEIVLEGGSVTNSGRLDASSVTGKGGTVRLLGEEVGVIAAGSIDASGAAGGGIILVGGDYQGKSQEIRNARFTYVGVDAQLNANATDSGDGGKVIVWANEATRYYGSISARGGAMRGNGGQVEISGKRSMRFAGRVDASAPQGNAGSVLLDPDDIFITAGPGPNPGNAADGLWTYAEDPGSQSIGADAIITLLGTANLTLQANNNIDVAASVDVNYSASNDRTLLLQAGNSIIVNGGAQIRSTGLNALNVTLHADSDNSGAGVISMGSGSSILSNGGAIILGGGANPAINPARSATGSTAGVTLFGATLNAGIGDITIRGQGATAASGQNFGVYISGNSTLSTGTGAISITGQGGDGAGFNENQGVYLTGNGGTVIINALSAGGNIAITGTGGAGAMFNDGVQIQQGVNITAAAGNIGINGTRGSGATGQANAGVSFVGGGGNTSRVIEVFGNGNITITGGGTAAGATDNNNGVSLGSSTVRIDGAGTLAITGTGGGAGNFNRGVSVSGSVLRSTGGALSIDSTNVGSTSLSIDSTAVQAGSTLTLLSSGNVDLNVGTSLSAPVISATGTNVSLYDGTLNVGGVGTAGTMGVTGNLFLGGAAILNMDIGGATAGTLYDQAAVSGNTTLGGTLNLSETGGFKSKFSDTFTLIAGGAAPGGGFGTFNAVTTGSSATLGTAVSGNNLDAKLASGTTNYLATGASNWNTAANWDRGTPNAFADAVINPGGTNTITVNSSGSAKSINVAANNTLTVTNSVTLTAANAVTNSGTVRIDSGSSSSTTVMTVGSGFTNNGLIELLTNPGSGGGTGVGVLNMSAGVLTNAVGATIRSAGTGSTDATTANVLNAEVTNLGAIDVQRGLTITNAGRTFTSSAGSLAISSGQILKVNGGTTSLGSGTSFSGTGTLNVAGPTLDLASALTLPGAGGVTVDLNGASAVTVSSGTPGTDLILPATGSLTLSNDTIASSVDLLNLGTVLVSGSGLSSAINGGLTNAATTGTIRVQSAGSPTTTLTVDQGFTNDGLIELLNNPGSGSGTGPSVLNVTNGTFTNAVGATFRSGGTGTTPADNVLNALMLNQGTVDVLRGLSITNAGRTFDSSGASTLSIASVQKLTVNGGITSLGSGTSFSGSGTLLIAGPTLDLASNLTLPGSGGVVLDLNGTNAVTVSSGTPGTDLILPATASLTLSNDTIASSVDLLNSGTVLVSGSGLSSAINGGLSNAATTGTISVQSAGSVTTTLTVDLGFTNDGLIELLNNPGSGGGTGPSVLNVTNGTFTNAAGATFRSGGTGTTPADNVLNALVLNQGTVDVVRGLSITNAGRTFDSSGASTLSIASGQKLTVNGGITSLGSGTSFSGSGTLLVAGPTLDLASNLTLPGSGGVVLDLNGTGAVTVSSGIPGTDLILSATGALTLSNDTIAASVDLLNAGTVLVSGSGLSSVINGGLSNAATTGTLIVQSAGSATTTLTVDQGFTNDGLIELLNNPGSGGGTGPSVLNVTNGTFTNATGATFRSAGTGTTPVNNTLGATVVNQGTLDIQRGLTVTSLATNDGTITFSVNNPTLTLSNAALSNNAAGVIQGVGTVNVGAGTLANSGIIRPGGAGAAGTLGITGGFSNAGTVEFELGGTTAGTQYDVLAVSGALTRGGTVAFSEINGFVTDGGQTFTPFTHASASGTFALTSPTDVTLAPTYGATSTPFLSSVITRFTGATSSAWEIGTNWTRGTPTANKDAVVNVTGQTKTATVSTGTQVAKSLTLGDDETVSITGGSLQLDGTSTAAAGTTLSLSGGTLTGAGVLTVGGQFNWSGNSVISGSGTLTTLGATALAPAFNQTTALRGSRTWDNYGTVTFTPNIGTLSHFQIDDATGDGVAVFNNQAGGVFNLNAPVSDNHVTGFGTFNNAGQFNKNLSGSAVTSGFVPAFNNLSGGVVNVTSGTLRFDAGGTDAGNYVLSNNATLHFNGGPRAIAGDIGGTGNVIFSKPQTATAVYTMSGDYNVSGSTAANLDDLGAAGDLIFNGTVTNLGSSYSQSGGITNVSFTGITGGAATGFKNLTSVSVNNGSLTLAGGTDLTGVTTLTRAGSGTLDLADSNLSLSTLNVTGGILTGTGSISVSGAFNWGGGLTSYITGSGTLTTLAGSTSTLTPGFARTISLRGSRVWDNYGTATLTPDAGTISYFEIDDTLTGGTAVLNNRAGGVFNLNPSYNDNHIVGVGTFNNAGTLNKNLNGTVASSGINPVLNNLAGGVVNVTSGSLIIGGALSQAGTINIASGASFNKTAGFTNSGTLAGGGSIVVGTGASKLVNQGSITPGGTGTRGTLSVSGDLQFSAGGTVEFDVSGSATPGTDYDSLSISGAATLGGTVNVNEVGGFKTRFSDAITPVLYGSRTGTFGTINSVLTSGTAAFGATFNATNAVFALASGTTNYIATGASNWSTGANWDRGTPNGNADAVIATAGTTNTVTINNAQSARSLTVSSAGGGITNTVALTGGSLTLAQNSSVDVNSGLSLSSGTLDLGAALTVDSTLGFGGVTVIGGVLNSTGTTTLTGTPILNGTAIWNNSGTLNIGGGDRVQVQGTATVNNLSSGIINDTTSHPNPFEGNGSSSTFTNSGTFNKNAGSLATQSISTLSFTNPGTINVNSGTFNLTTTATDTGTYAVASGATLGVTTNTRSFNGTTFTGGGVLSLISGAMDFATNTTFGAGNPTLSLTGGTLTGAGNLTVNTALNLGGTTFTGAGGGTFNTGGTTTLTGTPILNGTAIWNNSGTLNIGGGDRVQVQGTATVNNLSSGTINDTTSHPNPFEGNGSSSTFTNSGTFNKNAGSLATQSISTLSFTNPGTINVNSGIFDVTRPGIDIGNYAVGSGATLQVSTGTRSFNGTTFTGGGVLSLISGAMDFATNTTFGAGNPTLSLTGGTLTGAGNLTVNTALNLGGTTFTGAGGGTFNTGGTTTLTGTPILNGTAIWNNSGTLNIGGGDRVQVQGTATVNNLSSGIINDTTSHPNPFEGNGSSSTFTNSGAFNKNAGSLATQSISTLSFTNPGTINVNSGTFQVAGTATEAGTINVAALATFQKSAGFTNTGTLSGSGTIAVSTGAAKLVNQGTINPGGTGAAGTLTVNGDVQLDPASILNVELGGTTAGTQYDVLAVNGNVTVGGTLNASLTGGYVPVNGDALSILTMTGTASGTFAGAPPSSLPANMFAGYNLAASEAARLIYFFSPSGTKTFVNGAGNLNWGTAANWSDGTLPGVADEALISTGFAVTHANGNDAIAALTVNSGNALNVSGGSLTVGGVTNAAGSITVSGGTLALNGTSSVSTLGLSSGALNGSGDLTVGNAFNYSGGTVGLSGALDVTHAGKLTLPAMGSLTSLLARATGDISLSGNIAASGSGNAITLVAGGDFLNSGNYTLSPGSGRWLVYSQDPASIVKGGLSAGFKRYNCTFSAGCLTAGTTIPGTGDGFVYSIAPVITVTPDGQTVTYGNAGYTSTLSGFIDGDTALADTSGTIALSVGGTTSTSGNPIVGIHELTYTSGLSSVLGYQFQDAASTNELTVNARALTVTATGVNRAYDATLVATATLADNRVGGDVLTVGSGAIGFLDKNVNAGKTVNVNGITLGGADSGNYTFNTTAVTNADITAANLTLSTSNVTKTYDGGLSALGTATVTGGTLFSGDALTGGSFAFTDKNVGAGKTVTAGGVTVGDGVNFGNYNVSYANNTASTITAANLTLSTSNVTKTYDGGLSALGTATVTGGTLFSGDTLTGGSFAFTDKNVGAGKTVTAGGVTVGDGVNFGNYNVTYANNTASTITAANLTLSTSNVTKTYDGGLSALGTATVTGGTLFSGDTLTGGSFAFTDKNVGASKTVTAGGVTVGDGVNFGNYNVSYANNTASTITQLGSVAWTSGAPGNWSNPTNWAGGALPDGNNVAAVSIPPGANVTYDAATGATQLTSLTSQGNLSVTGGALTLGNAPADVSQVQSASLNLSAGKLTVNGSLQASVLRVSGGTLDGTGNLASPDFAQTGGTFSPGLSNLLLASVGNFNLTSPLGATQSISLSSIGAILDGLSPGPLATLSAPSVQLTAATGIGTAAAPLRLSTSTLQATTATGTIQLYNTPVSGVVLQSVTTGSNSNITYDQDGQTLNVIGPVTSQGGVIVIDPPTDVTLNGTVATTGSGSVTIEALNNLVMAPSATVNSGSGGVSLLAGGNISLAAINAGSGNAVIQSSAASIGTATPGVNNVTASDITLNAQTGIQMGYIASALHVSNTSGLILLTDFGTGLSITNQVPPVTSTETATLNQIVTTVIQQSLAPVQTTTTNEIKQTGDSGTTTIETKNAVDDKTKEKEAEKPADKPITQTVTVGGNTVKKSAEETVNTGKVKGQTLVCKVTK